MTVLETSHDDGVVTVTLNRPEKRNALSIELRELLERTFDGLCVDDSVRCVILTGAGSAFCAGMDVTQFGGDAEHKRKLVESSSGAFRTVGSCAKPVICAINGPAIAGGFALAMLGDIRIASQSARLGFAEMRLGLAASYAALRNVVSAGVAKELCLTGRTVDADEALRLGLVNEVSPDAELAPRATAVARQIANLPPQAVLEVKRRILFDAEASYGRLFEEELRVFREELIEAERPVQEPSAPRLPS